MEICNIVLYHGVTIASKIECINICILFCDGFCEASVSTNIGSVIVNQQLYEISRFEFFSKVGMGSITDEKRHSKLKN
jgi:hypothetical protein